MKRRKMLKVFGNRVLRKCKKVVEDRGQREGGSGSGRPLVSGSTQFANE
jgi:hypothetical protein